MWFTCAHPIYRMVIPAFLSDFLVMPENLKAAVRYWFHGTVTGTPDKCEGLNFIGESYNRYVLSTIPPRPTFNDWRIGIRSEGFVQTCQEITKELVGKVPFRNRTATPHTPDVLSWHETLHGKLDLSKKNLKGDDIPNPTVFLTASTLMRDHLSKQFKTFTPFSKSSLCYNSFFPKDFKKVEESEEKEEEKEKEEERVPQIVDVGELSKVEEVEEQEEEDLEVLLAKQLSLKEVEEKEKVSQTSTLSKEEEGKRKREERRQYPREGAKRRRRESSWYEDFLLS